MLRNFDDPPLLKDGQSNHSTNKKAMLNPKRHEIWSIVLLGLGTLFLMTGYDTQSFIVESVLHSVNAREPQKIDGHAGYYGQATLYAAYTLCTLISPWLCYRLGSKWSLTIGSLLFSVYMTGFFHLNSYFYYGSQIMMGMGFALYYSGQGQYMAEHSRRKSISRNSALISVIGNAGMCLGGLVLLIINFYSPKTTSMAVAGGANETSTETSVVGFRNFSDVDIYILFGTFLAATVLANVIFSLLPNKQFDSLAQKDTIEAPTIKTQIQLITSAICEPRIILLSMFFICYGLQVSFMLSAFPTTFAFTRSLASNSQLAAIYSITIGLGNIIMGLYINFFSRRWPSFGLAPTMATQLVLAAAAYGLILISTPNHSSIRPTDDETLMFSPSPLLCLLMGLLLGMADGCLCPMRVIVCTLVIPHKKLQTYSVAKLYQSLASCVAFFVSPYLTIQHWIALLTVAQIASGIAFFFVARSIEKDAKKERDAAANDVQKLT